MRENEAVLLDIGYKPGIERAPRPVNFSLVFPDETVRATAEAHVTSHGFTWQLSEEAVEPDTAEATATITLQPAARAITAAEIKLIDSIAPLGGYVDGWGFFRDTEH